MTHRYLPCGCRRDGGVICQDHDRREPRQAADWLSGLAILSFVFAISVVLA